MGIPLSDAINNGYTANDILDECLNIQLGTANIDISPRSLSMLKSIKTLSLLLLPFPISR
jgi:hypothetical protein